MTTIEFTRINNDVNGNPRYVCHFTNLLPRVPRVSNVNDGYEYALKLAHKIGGRKFHNKQYGGGIVLQSYNLDALRAQISQLIISKN